MPAKHISIKVFFIVMMLSSCMLTNLFAQKKLEREYRIQEKNVPQLAADFIKRCFPETKIKWYAEEGLYEKTIEAKIRSKPNIFSIEFDTLGNLQDVELLIDIELLEPALLSTIRQELTHTFSRYKIIRCQVQWLGPDLALQELITRGETRLPYQTNYEIVLKGKSGKSKELYEFLFDDNGRVIQSSVLIQRNINNLFY